jgi:hypothetical protein
MQISLFPKITDNRPQPRTFATFAEFVTELGSHNFGYTEKLAVPAFSPAEYPPGARRSKAKVKAVHLGVLDIDKVTGDQMSALEETLTPGLGFLFYSTWSSAANAPRTCGRLIVKFSRPVQASEWDAFWPRFNARFGGLADPACKDPSRVYFTPAAPAGTEDETIYYYEPGAPLDVDEILRMSLASAEAAAGKKTDVVRKDLEGLVAKLKRRQSAHYKKLGQRLGQVLEGQSFAEEGERDEVIFQLTGILVETWPHAEPATLASFFAQSIAVMTKLSATCPTIETVENKLKRHQETVLEDEAAEEQTQIAKRALNIQQAFANGRSHPYTQEELTAFSTTAGISREAFQKRWIIQRASSFYLYFNGNYLQPLTDNDVVNAAVRDLAPAHSAGVDLWKVNARGDLVLKSVLEMIKDYGTIARNIVVDLAAQRSHFDDKTQTLVEAPCPLRHLKPTYDHEVDEWLKWLAGSMWETLCDWLAVVTRLDEPCAALYLDGAPGVGKSLLADGLARLWTEEKPTLLDETMGNFNGSLVSCPLVLADETIPKDFKGRVRTSELRQIIQGRSRALTRKFLPNASMRGAIRLIIAANNQDLLTSNEALSTNDIQAIVDRIIYIYCPKNAAKYLRKVNTRSFVKEDRIARHALWLSQHRVVQQGRRFLVEGSDSTLHRTLTTSSGLRSAVCNWLVSYLLSPTQIDSIGKLLVRRHDKMLLATARGIAEAWKVYPTNEFAAPVGKISQALAGLSEATKAQLRDGEQRRTHYWIIDLQNLITWADRNGYATEEAIIEALAKPQEIRVPRAFN